MPEPWELTEEEVTAEKRRMAPRRDEADQDDAYLYAEVYALLNASEEELAVLPADEAESVREYHAGHRRAVDADADA